MLVERLCTRLRYGHQFANRLEQQRHIERFFHQGIRQKGHEADELQYQETRPDPFTLYCETFNRAEISFTPNGFLNNSRKIRRRVSSPKALRALMQSSPVTTTVIAEPAEAAS